MGRGSALLQVTEDWQLGLSQDLLGRNAIAVGRSEGGTKSTRSIDSEKRSAGSTTVVARKQRSSLKGRRRRVREAGSGSESGSGSVRQAGQDEDRRRQ